MKIYRHKTDVIIILFLLSVAAIIMLINYKTAKKGNIVTVYSDKKNIATYDINKNDEYTITTEYGTNTIKINNGKVSVISASCSNQVCVNHLPIKTSDESIICLPNHLVVKIDNDKKSEVDDIAK